MNIFFTADTHFNHQNIIKFCPNSRGRFNDVDEMNEAIIKAWNDTVRNQDDIVYHLGDWFFGPPDKVEGIMERLNGTIRHIKGNHDTSRYLNRISPYVEWSKECNKEIIDDIYVHMYHYPVKHWDKQNHGSFHLFGHVHAKPGVAYGRSMDVGIDTRPTDLRPYSWEEIKKRLSTLNVEEYH